MFSRMLAPLMALALAAALAPAAPAALAASPGEPARRAAAIESVQLAGRGYGHGHGMSQYGAQGAAREGRTHREILAFYYPGVAWGGAGGTIAVLITADRTKDVVVSARPGLTARQVGESRALALAELRPRATRWRVMPLAGARSGIDYWQDGWRRLTTLAGDVELVAGGRPLTLWTDEGRVAYRGVLRSAQGDTVNVVPLDGYLRGVVPVEVPALWHPEAVRAQAVAARTYAAFERAAAPRARHYQVCDTSECQVYGGFSAEHPASSAAVRATAGGVLTAGGRPAFTQFSASNGGWAASGGRTYLPAQRDPYDSWTGNPYRTWRATLSAAAVERAFPAVGDLTGVQVILRDGDGQWGGRATRVRITGSAGSGVVTGDTFRSVFGLRSTYFTVL